MTCICLPLSCFVRFRVNINKHIFYYFADTPHWMSSIRPAIECTTRIFLSFYKIDQGLLLRMFWKDGKTAGTPVPILRSWRMGNTKLWVELQASGTKLHLEMKKALQVVNAQIGTKRSFPANIFVLYSKIQSKHRMIWVRCTKASPY